MILIKRKKISVILILNSTFLFTSILGIVGFFFEFKSLQMVPPATVSTLRTTEIVVAYVVNIFLTDAMPEILNVFGSTLVLFAAISLIFEREIYENVSWLISCNSSEKSDIKYNLINDEVD